MSLGDMALLVAAPIVWAIGYFQYTPEMRRWPVTRFWLRLTFAAAVLAMGATLLGLFFDKGDWARDILRLVSGAALVPVAFWFIVATVRGWSKRRTAATGDGSTTPWMPACW